VTTIADRPKERDVQRDQRGSTIVEFALVLPVILLLVFGMIEFGRVLNAQVIIRNAAREGARVGSVGKSAGDITAVVQSMTSTLGNDAATISVTNAQGDSGERVVVHIDYTVNVVTPLISVFFGGSDVPLSAESSMRLE